jgi:hypothetical protein
MTIYLMLEESRPVRAYKNIELAKTALDTRMFALCKQGNRIESVREGVQYIYSHPRENVKKSIWLTEVELQD